MWKTGLRAPVSSVEICGRNVEGNRLSVWNALHNFARAGELAFDENDELHPLP